LIFYFTPEKNYSSNVFRLGSKNKYKNEFPNNDLITIEDYLSS